MLMQGDNVFDGYYQQPEESAEALRDGWLHTGDAGYLQEDGQLVVLGRVSEVVYTQGGDRFIPTYIENRLQFSQYIQRSQERRVGKECGRTDRYWWSAYHEKKNTQTNHTDKYITYTT